MIFNSFNCKLDVDFKMFGYKQIDSSYRKLKLQIINDILSKDDHYCYNEIEFSLLMNNKYTKF